MTTGIKNGTIVTSDLTYRSDVKIDANRIVERSKISAGAIVLRSGAVEMAGIVV